VADGSMWLVRRLRNFVVQLQTGQLCHFVLPGVEQVSRLRATRLPGYSANSSNSRAQSADRRPVAATATTVVKHDTPSSTSSDRSTSSTVESDVTPTDTPPTTTQKTSTKQPTARKASQLRPPKTIVARHRLQQQSDGAVDASTVSLRRGIHIAALLYSKLSCRRETARNLYSPTHLRSLRIIRNNTLEGVCQSLLVFY